MNVIKDYPATEKEKKQIIEYVNKKFQGHTGYLDFALSMAEYNVYIALRYLKFVKNLHENERYDSHRPPRPNYQYGLSSEQIEA